MKAGSTAMTQRSRDWVPSGSLLALPDPRSPYRANPRTNCCWTPLFFFFDSTGMIYMHWVPTGQTVNKEYYVEVLREFRKRFRRKRPALFKSGQWHFHQDNAPVHNSILVTDYLTNMSIKTVPQPPYSPEAVTKVIDTLTQEDFHGPSRSCWNGTTSALQAEEITSKGTKVSCVYYQ